VIVGRALCTDILHFPARVLVIQAAPESLSFASIAGKLLGAHIVLVDTCGQEHLAHRRHHRGRTRDVVHGAPQIDRCRFSISRLIMPVSPCHGAFDSAILVIVGTK